MKYLPVLLTSWLSLLISFTAYGDDIEIYYGISDQSITVNPNVVFIFDTSGSMASTDFTQSSRMFKSKEALKLALDNISGVNVSLMRFSDRGGPVLMPLSDIDDPWQDKEVTRSLYGDYDFAYSFSSGSLNTKFSSGYLTDNYHRRAHAMRFTDMDIPKGAKIESAHVTYFSVSGSSVNSVNIEYFGSTKNDPPEFVDGAVFNDLYLEGGSTATTARGCGNSGVVCWRPDGWLGLDYPMNTPDLSPIVQQIIDQNNWSTGDPILLFGIADSITTYDEFRYFSHADGYYTRQKSPQLRVRYSMPSAAEGDYRVRNKMRSLLEEFVAEGGTPVVDTFYEAYLYLNGKAPVNGLRRGNGAKLKSLSRISHPETIDGSGITNPVDCDTEKLTAYECRERRYSDTSSAVYKSPIDEKLGQCQANYIVLFSDGSPNSTYQSSAIASAIGSSCSGEGCANKLAEYMATKPSDRADSSSKDVQAFTYTVGFESSGFNDQYLKDLAAAGKGTFYSGNTATELAQAFTSILIEAKKGASTFVAPGISVNQFNRLTHSDDIYYALFDPRSTEYWPGNLKKYKLIDSIVEDKAGVDAIASDGFFRDDAHDYWATSSELTGSFVARGGAAANQSSPRRLYTNVSPSSTTIIENDLRITKQLLNIESWPDSDAARKTLIQWMRGYDVLDLDQDGITNEPRYQMADPLHSEPLFFNYEGGKASVFIGTNEGYLLSIDAETGRENWAFMPKDLIKNVPVYYNNPSVFNNRTYGIDGAINVWKDGNKSYLIVGQRRGGARYYVLDVTNRTNPVFKYEISSDADSAFSNLGQSWSKPILTSIKIGNTETQVFIFGGGYDPNQDDAVLREQDSIGSSIFIVEASTGTKLVEISNHSDATHVNADMNYSIPGRIAVIDKDFDGLVDHLYAGDMGGQLFRFDIYNGQPLNKLVLGQKIYQTSVDNSASKNRRYYNAPDVAEIVHDNEHYYAVVIGSGYRAHPLNEVIQDSVIMLKDKSIFSPDEDGLYGFTEFTSIAQIAPDSPSIFDISTYDGYEFNLATGEKVLTGVSIINSKLVFSTYDPSSAGLIENSCASAQGGGRLYVISLLDGQPLVDLDDDGQLTYEDSFVELDKSGIPAEPRIIIADALSPTVCIGTECADTIISDDDENDLFKKLAGYITGNRSNLNRVFLHSWSSTVEPTEKGEE